MNLTQFPRISALICCFSNILFLNSMRVGACLLGVIGLNNPNCAAAGLLSVFFTLVIARIFNIAGHVLDRSMFFYNAALVGFAFGYRFSLDLEGLIVLASLTAASFFLCIFVESLFRTMSLPVLSIPFAFTNLIYSFASKNFHNLQEVSFYRSTVAVLFLPDLNPMVQSFFKSVGMIFFVPETPVGLFIFLLTICYSPLTALFLAFGFLEGVKLEGWITADPNVILKSHLFNYSLTFLALSGTFLVPSLTSFVIASLAVALSVLVSLGLGYFFSAYAISLSAIPFNLTLIPVVHAINYAVLKWKNTSGAKCPEDSLDQEELKRVRFGNALPAPCLPIEGAWEVQQGFSDVWTHKGNWSNAVDFVKISEEGKTHRGKGIELEEYFCFAQPVVSPISGTVVSIECDIDDNRIGVVNNQKNWGNNLLIRSDFGYYVLLAHFKKGSLKPRLGEYIKLGEEIGKCGNSGYSKEPHLHMQVQGLPERDAATIPWHFSAFKQLGEIRYNSVPVKGARVERIPSNLPLSAGLSFAIDSTYEFENERGDTVKVQNVLDPRTGLVYLKEGNSTLQYWKDINWFYFYKWKVYPNTALEHLLFAMPRIPLVFGEPTRFKDFLENSRQESVLARTYYHVCSFFSSSIQRSPLRYSFDPATLILRGSVTVRGRSVETSASLDPLFGIMEFTCGEKKYRRKISKEVSILDTFGDHSNTSSFEHRLSG